MKYATKTKYPPPTHPEANHVGVLEPPTFFAHVAKQVGRKPFYLGLRLSKTLVDMWCTGEKRDVFTAAKEACEIVRQERRADLIPAILVYILGGYDGTVLNTEQTAALRLLVSAVRKDKE